MKLIDQIDAMTILSFSGNNNNCLKSDRSLVHFHQRLRCHVRSSGNERSRYNIVRRASRLLDRDRCITTGIRGLSNTRAGNSPISLADRLIPYFQIKEKVRCMNSLFRQIISNYHCSAVLDVFIYRYQLHTEAKLITISSYFDL